MPTARIGVKRSNKAGPRRITPVIQLTARGDQTFRDAVILVSKKRNITGPDFVREALIAHAGPEIETAESFLKGFKDGEVAPATGGKPV